MPAFLHFVRLVCVGVICLLVVPCKSLAIEATITNFLITNTRDNVLVYFLVKDCFTDDMEEAILAGIPTTFTFYVKLHRVRGFWFDKEISDVKIKHTIKYDNVKKTFYVYCEEKGSNAEQFKDFTRAKIAMSDLSGIIVGPLNKLTRNRKYYVRVKAELDKVRLPLHMEYVFFFVSLWDFETDWYQEEFIY